MIFYISPILPIGSKYIATKSKGLVRNICASIIHLQFPQTKTSAGFLAGRADVTVTGPAGAGPYLTCLLILGAQADPVCALLGSASAVLLGHPHVLLEVELRTLTDL